MGPAWIGLVGLFLAAGALLSLREAEQAFEEFWRETFYRFTTYLTPVAAGLIIFGLMVAVWEENQYAIAFSVLFGGIGILAISAGWMTVEVNSTFQPARKALARRRAGQFALPGFLILAVGMIGIFL